MRPNPQELFNVLNKYFTVNEIKSLCFELGIDYEDLKGRSKRDLIINLISYTQRTDRLNEFADAIKKFRPNIQFGRIDESDLSPNSKALADRKSLLKTLLKYFTVSEIDILCFELGIDYENLMGNTLLERSQDLILYVQRRGQLNELVNLIESQRPQIQFSRIDNSDSLQNTELFPNIDVLAEVKLVLVGDGNVGKTSLVNRLISNSFNQEENTTRGIAIVRCPLNIEHPKIDKVQLNIWDFGGQGNMHAAHPYFFSRKAIYLLVLNVREDDRFNRVEYWLRLIHAHGGDSQIIVVSNKIDQFSARLDERTLGAKYPNIIDFVRTSCENGTGIPELKASIAKAVSNFEDIGVRTPVSMLNTKRELESMCDFSLENAKDTLSIDEFESLCQKHEVQADATTGFLRRLNQLGVVLYYGEDARLDLNVVLNPIWVTQGVYAVINHDMIAKARGAFEAAQLRYFLPRNRYPAEKAAYILEIMRKFELCFPLDDKGNTFLLPDLLPPEQPELPDFDQENAVRIDYEYPVWQSSIFTRLIVRLYHYLVPDTYWRNGAIFQKADDGNRALVIVDEVDRRLRIWVDGPVATRRYFLNRIREELNVIHGIQREHGIKELVATKHGGELPYQLLVELDKKGRATYETLINNELVEINIKELLDGVRADIIPEEYRLVELIVERFSLDELDKLCFKFKLSLEDISGQTTKDSKARNLVRQFVRNQRLPELMAALREARKGMEWV